MDGEMTPKPTLKQKMAKTIRDTSLVDWYDVVWVAIAAGFIGVAWAIAWANKP